PQPDIARLKERMGWNWPWYTITSDWDVDFGVDEYHGTNAFIRDGDRVFRTYFVDNRGDEALGSTWSYLDLAALGRQETWEDSPEGYPQSAPYVWWNWHDEYDHPEMAQGPMKGWGMLRSDYRAGEQAGSGAWTSPRPGRWTACACSTCRARSPGRSPVGSWPTSAPTWSGPNCPAPTSRRRSAR
ncbi:MAG TPA: DUF899 family protein, partial [Streptosporangiaceae bacterium]